MADAPLFVRGRVNGMGEIDPNGSYVGFAYHEDGTRKCEHRIKVSLVAAELIVAEIQSALHQSSKKQETA